VRQKAASSVTSQFTAPASDRRDRCRL
jgi:hypothetical protein